MTPEQAITAFVTIIIVLALVAIFCIVWVMTNRAKNKRSNSPLPGRSRPEPPCSNIEHKPLMDIQRENMRNLYGDNTD